MNAWKVWSVAAIALSGGACEGSHHGNGTSLDHYGQEVAQSLDDLEATTAAHH